MSSLTRTIGSVAAAAVFVLAACGGDDDSATSPDDTSADAPVDKGADGDTEPGVLVSGVSEGTSAQDAGIMTDDLLTGWNGSQIIGVREWMLMMAEHEPGDIVTVTVLRSGELSTR